VMRNLTQTIAVVACLLLLGAAPALTKYPEKPITLIVPFAAGGTGDGTILTPIGLVAEFPMAIITRRDFPADSPREFVCGSQADERFSRCESASLVAAIVTWPMTATCVKRLFARR
jgi:tripartite-type tricarboxylate transporter receptor subunit TctC